jgi:hypothetical protein
VLLRDVLTPRQEVEEGFLVLGDRARAAEMREFAERIGAVEQAEAAIDAGGEFLPGRRCSEVLLLAVIPLTGRASR